MDSTDDPADVCVWAAREMRATARAMVREAHQLESEHSLESAVAMKRLALRLVRDALYVMRKIAPSR